MAFSKLCEDTYEDLKIKIYARTKPAAIFLYDKSAGIYSVLQASEKKLRKRKKYLKCAEM